MTGGVRDELRLVDMAYLYAMDALTDSERLRVQRLLGRADAMTVTAFAAAVSGAYETLAALTILDTVPAPTDLEAKVLRALNAAPSTDRRPWPPGGPAEPISESGRSANPTTPADTGAVGFGAAALGVVVALGFLVSAAAVVSVLRHVQKNRMRE